MAEDDKPKPRTREQKNQDREKAHKEVADRRAEHDLELTLRSTADEVTAVDPLGIERIVTTGYSYDPPEVEPDEAEVKRLENVQKRLDNAREARAKALTETPDGARKVLADAVKGENSGTSSTSSNSGEGVSSTSQVKKGGNS